MTLVAVRSNCDVGVCTAMPCAAYVPREGAAESCGLAPARGSGGPAAAMRPRPVRRRDGLQQLGMRIDL